MEIINLIIALLCMWGSKYLDRTEADDNSFNSFMSSAIYLMGILNLVVFIKKAML